MHKTIGRSAQPNRGSKKKFLGALPWTPVEGSYPPPSNPPLHNQRNEGGAPPPPLTPRLTTWASRGKNITQPNIITLVVLLPQESLVIYPTLQCPLFLYTKRTFQSSHIFSMHLQYSSKCPLLVATPFCLLSYPSQSDIEHQCALSLNGKQGSFPRKLHFGYHNLSL